MIDLRSDTPARSWTPPKFGHPVSIESYTGPQGNDEQVTAQTIHIMARLVREDATDPVITGAASTVRQSLPPRATTKDFADAVFWYVKSRVTFVGDEQQIEPFDFNFPPDELLIRPAALLTMEDPMDDCDGFSMLCAAILRAIGIQCSFKTIAARKSTPATYSHVYLVAHLEDGQPYPIDASNGPLPGTEAHPTYKSRLWPIDESPTNMIHAAPPKRLGEFDYGKLISSITDMTGKILIPRYGVPPAGTYINTTPTGQTISTAPGGGVTAAVGNMDSSTLLMLGGGALLLVLLISSRR